MISDQLVLRWKEIMHKKYDHTCHLTERSSIYTFPAIYSADFKGLVGDSNTRKVACMTFSFIFLLPFHISNAHW